MGAVKFLAWLLVFALVVPIVLVLGIAVVYVWIASIGVMS